MVIYALGLAHEKVDIWNKVTNSQNSQVGH